jgi:RNA polymerase sigma-70 factor (ECF subfamily)
VLAFITAKCRRTDDIADIFQNTYMELYSVLSKRGADYIANDTAFVMRLARRKVARFYSLAERLRMFVSPFTTDENGEETDITDCEADAFALEDFVVNREVLEDARRYIRSLPETTQKVFYLFYELEHTIAETAKALAISESNVKNKLYRTLKDLKNLLK